jgi:hypothetical protein
MKLGIEKTAMVRLRAGISYALTEAMDEGHCGLPTEAHTYAAKVTEGLIRENEMPTHSPGERRDPRTATDVSSGRWCVLSYRGSVAMRISLEWPLAGVRVYALRRFRPSVQDQSLSPSPTDSPRS